MVVCFNRMKFYRFATLAWAAVALFSSASLVRADTVEVNFNGLIYATNTPGISAGDSFSGSFSYSTSDPFEGSSGGLDTYLLTSPEDGLSVSVDGSTLSLGQPLSGVTAIIGLAPLSFDSNPHQDYFAVEGGSSAGTVSTSFDLPGYAYAGLSVQLVGAPSFLSPGALPDPLNTSDVTLGLVSGAINSVVSFDFEDANSDVYFTAGYITELSAGVSASAVPEPHGLGLACLGIVALALLLFRRSAVALT
jgi:hypothetical protein